MKPLLTLIDRPRWPVPWSLRLQFDARDIWIGVFWAVGSLQRRDGRLVRSFHVYVCVVPTLPVHLLVWWPA